MVEAEPATSAEPYHLPLMVPQFLTERVMRARLGELGHCPDFSTELTGLDTPPAGLGARFAPVETLRSNGW